MKPIFYPALVALCLGVVSCDRGPSPSTAEAERRLEEQRRAVDARLAELDERERRAAEEQAAAQQTQEREVLAAERETLQREKAQLMKDRIASDRKVAKTETEIREAKERADRADAAARRTAQRAEEAEQSRTMDFFYSALEPLGEWIDLEGQGSCWKPAESRDPSWRPYTNGRWVHTEYGWTWKSNEPFGWATYHYGRWTRLKRVGWIWVPGSEWGPAWVSWRTSAKHIGWAPLPPEAWSSSGFNGAVDSYYDIGPSTYTFVPVDSLGDATYIGKVVAPERNVTIVNETVNVTNITYTTVENRTVTYNAGPDLQEVNSQARERVPSLRVERVTGAQPLTAAPAAIFEGVLKIVAPRIEGRAKGAAPLRNAERVSSRDVDRGWEDSGDRDAVQRMRVRFSDEARRAEAQPQRPAAPAPVSQPTRAPASVDAAPATPIAPPVENVPPERERRRRDRDSATPSPGTPPATPPAATPPPATPRAPRATPKKPATPPPATPVATPTPATPPSATPRKPRATPAPATPVATPVPATPTPTTPRKPRATPMAATPEPAPAAATPVPATPKPPRATPEPSTAVPPATPAAAKPMEGRRPVAIPSSEIPAPPVADEKPESAAPGARPMRATPAMKSDVPPASALATPPAAGDARRPGRERRDERRDARKDAEAAREGEAPGGPKRNRTPDADAPSQPPGAPQIPDATPAPPKRPAASTENPPVPPEAGLPPPGALATPAPGDAELERRRPRALKQRPAAPAAPSEVTPQP